MTYKPGDRVRISPRFIEELKRQRLHRASEDDGLGTVRKVITSKVVSVDIDGAVWPGRLLSLENIESA